MDAEEKIAKYQAELDRIHDTLAEQDRYDTLKSAGPFGSETQFVNPDKLYKRQEWLENRITNLSSSL